MLENRLIKQWRPAGNVKLKRADGYVYIRARLDIAYPVLEVAPEPAARARVQRRPGARPRRGRGARGPAPVALRPAPLRPRAPRRWHASAYGQMGRCLSPCLGDLDPNLYRRRLEEALAPFSGEGDRGEGLIAWIDEQMRGGGGARGATSAPPCCCAAASGSGPARPASAACSRPPTRARAWCSRRHPSKERWDAFWIVAGRVVDWGELPAAGRAARAHRAALGCAAAAPAPPWSSPEEVDEIRIVHSWIAANDPPQLPLDDEAPDAVVAWLG